jgi:hypothetical protein
VQNINSSVMPGMGTNRDKNNYFYPEFQVCRLNGKGREEKEKTDRTRSTRQDFVFVGVCVEHARVSRVW